MNVDASWDSHPPSTGVGIIFRNSEGLIKGAKCALFDVEYMGPNAELWIIIEGLKMAISMSCEYLWVESNNMVAINLITKKSEQWGEAEVFLDLIWTLVPSFKKN